MNQYLEQVAQVMQLTHHRDISQYDEVFLMKTLAKRLTSTGIESAADYAEKLAGSREEAAAFCSLLNIAYSEFFRNPLTFALLEQWILPSLIAEKQKAGQGKIRVWSAGCAAGQEIYSVAILLDEMAEGAESAIATRLFATDYSSKDLALARLGVYDMAAVRNVRQKHMQKYFIQDGDTYRLIERIKDRVDFSVYDLLDEKTASPAASIYGDFDLVFCSNLLFYYRPEIRHAILDKVYQSLTPNGFLVTGEAERDIVSRQAGWKVIAPPSAIFQKIMHRGGL